MSVKDVRFVDYINEKLSRYEEGEPIEADQLMTLTANKYKNMMIQNQWEAPSPHDATIQALKSKVEKLQRELKRAPKVSQQKNLHKKNEGQSTKPQHPKWLTNNETPQKGQLSRTRVWIGNKWYWCSKETGGKCEGHWVRHPPVSCEGKAFRSFNKKGMRKDAPKQDKSEKKTKRNEENDNGKERKCNRLTATFATAYNEANNSSENDE